MGFKVSWRYHETNRVATTEYTFDTLEQAKQSAGLGNGLLGVFAHFWAHPVPREREEASSFMEEQLALIKGDLEGLLEGLPVHAPSFYCLDCRDGWHHNSKQYLTDWMDRHRPCTVIDEVGVLERAIDYLITLSRHPEIAPAKPGKPQSF